MSRERRVLWAGGALFLVWSIVAWAVAPAVLVALYEERGPVFLNDVLAGRNEHDVGFYQAKWTRLALGVSAIWGILLPLTQARFRRRPWPAVAALLLFGVWLAAQVPDEVGGPAATSHELVAMGLLAGHGFASDGSYRDAHLGTPSSLMGSDAYLPTAYKEPVYPSVAAAAIWMFGDGARRAMAYFDVVCVLAAAVALALLGRAGFGRPVGGLAVLLWLAIPATRRVAIHQPTAEILAAPVILLAVWVTARCLQHPSVRRGVAAGAMTGVAALSFAAGLTVLPIGVLLILASFGSPAALRLKTALAMAATAAVVLLPWGVRNYLAFGEIVPVRSGSGYNLYVMNAILSDTFAPGDYACRDTLGPMWSASSPTDALERLEGRPARHALVYRGRDCFEQDPPEGWQRMNEVQVDNAYREAGARFVLQEPALMLRMASAKARYFYFTKVDAARAGLTALAALGAVLALAHPVGRLVVLVTLAIGLPHVLMNPMFTRFRYPSEPFLVLLASLTLVWIGSRIAAAVRRRGRAADG